MRARLRPMEITVRACDRCPPPQPGTVPKATTEQVFSHDGKRVAIDLCAEHTTAFLDDWDRMQEYMEHARIAPQTSASTVGVAVERREQRQRRPSSKENERIRRWAVEQGYQIGSKGRISDDIRRAYSEAAHGVDLGAEGAHQPEPAHA
jgi:hypothetical protein